MKARLIIVALLLPFIALAQPVKEWTLELPFDSSTYHQNVGGMLDAQGNFLWVVNKTDVPSPGVAVPKVQFRKISPSGNILWNTEYDNNGAQNVSMNQIDVDNGGNVYACGSYYIPMPVVGNSFRWKVVKVNASGILEWQHDLNVPNVMESRAQKILVSQGNDIYVAGVYYDTLWGTHKVVVKLNSAGNELWMKDYLCDAGSGESIFELDNFGNVIVSCSDSVFAINSSGNGVWSQPPAMNEPYIGNGPVSAVDAQNNVVLLAWVGSKYSLAKVSSSGVQWEVDSILYAAGFGDWNLHLATDASGSIYAGSVNQTWTTDTPYIYKYSAQGNFEWRTLLSYDPSDLEQQGSRLYTTGNFYEVDSPATKSKVEMLDTATGAVLWSDVLGSSPNHWISEDLIVGDDVLYTVTRITGLSGGDGMALVKYGNVNKVIEPETQFPDIKVYPIPATDEINIVIGSFDGNEGQLDLINMQGQVLSTLIMYPNTTVKVPIYDFANNVYVLKFGNSMTTFIVAKP